AGNKAFIAGADIGELAHVAAFEAEQSSRFGQGVLDLIEDLGKPVIAAVNGFALGGGCETAMACTIRLAVETAKFGQPEVTLGLVPGGGGTQRLPRLVGKGRALHLILSGEMIDAKEAYRIGLVNEIVPAAELITRAEAILKRIAANAPIAIKFALEAANKGIEMSQSDGLLLEASYFGVCAATGAQAIEARVRRCGGVESPAHLRRSHGFRRKGTGCRSSGLRHHVVLGKERLVVDDARCGFASDMAGGRQRQQCDGGRSLFR